MIEVKKMTCYYESGVLCETYGVFIDGKLRAEYQSKEEAQDFINGYLQLGGDL